MHTPNYLNYSFHFHYYPNKLLAVYFSNNQKFCYFHQCLIIIITTIIIIIITIILKEIKLTNYQYNDFSKDNYLPSNSLKFNHYFIINNSKYHYDSYCLIK